jgi:hypothetical protein
VELILKTVMEMMQYRCECRWGEESEWLGSGCGSIGLLSVGDVSSIVVASSLWTNHGMHKMGKF